MDKNYWNNYYKNHGNDKDIIQASSFAQFVSNKYLLKKKFNIIELGSGNGRDAIFFAQQKHNIIALDQSLEGMDAVRKIIDTDISNYFHPKKSDFVYEDYSKYKNVDMFYSRFSIHSITKSDELFLLPRIYDALGVDGLFCIEVRTTKDPICGIGEDCGENTYIKDNHKRRFIETKEFRTQVSELGFMEIYFIEQNNLSIVKNDNPTLMRIVLKK